MTISITVKNTLFVAREGSGYVFVNPDAIGWGRQVFDRHGSAEVARSAAELRRIARRWLAKQFTY